MARRPGTGPVTLEEIAPVFERCFAGSSHVVLAVSGGADSTALMHLAARWRVGRGARPPSFSVATVDHGLRPESAGEARSVAAAAEQLGFAHATLPWRGEKPKTALQAGAREARYRLLREHALACGWDRIATAHTLDDQAETVLMRLARGSGLDGLCGISETRDLDGGGTIVRPLLQFPKARLIATLRADCIPWLEDPSNDLIRFERTRWRRALPVLEELGLSHGQVGTSARRLARADEAVEQAVTMAAAAGSPAHLRIHALGYCEVHWPWLLQQAAEIRVRVLSRIVLAVGGGVDAPPLGRLEAMTEGADWQAPGGRTLGGAMFQIRGGGWVAIMREFGREIEGPACEVMPGREVLWDRRFLMRLGTDVARPFKAAALCAAGVSQIEASGWRRPDGVPARVLRALPGFWDGSRVVACPVLGFHASGGDLCRFGCECKALPFPGLECVSGGS